MYLGTRAALVHWPRCLRSAVSLSGASTTASLGVDGVQSCTAALAISATSTRSTPSTTRGLLSVICAEWRQALRGASTRNVLASGVRYVPPISHCGPRYVWSLRHVVMPAPPQSTEAAPPVHRWLGRGGHGGFLRLRPHSGRGGHLGLAWIFLAGELRHADIGRAALRRILPRRTRPDDG